MEPCPSLFPPTAHDWDSWDPSVVVTWGSTWTPAGPLHTATSSSNLLCFPYSDCYVFYSIILWIVIIIYTHTHSLIETREWDEERRVFVHPAYSTTSCTASCEVRDASAGCSSAAPCIGDWCRCMRYISDYIIHRFKFYKTHTTKLPHNHKLH
jgi:hypothetical protein